MSKTVRQIHRWLSVAFTIGFIIVSMSMIGG